jgi:hypothetical protein
MTATVTDINGIRTIVHGTINVTSDPDVAFVEKLYTDLLKRRGEADGIRFFSGQLQFGDATPGQVALEIQQSPEYRQVVVVTAFETVLGRSPESGGLLFWTNYLAQGHSQNQLLVALSASPEAWTVIAVLIPDIAGEPPLPDFRLVYLFRRFVGRYPSVDDSVAWARFLNSGASVVGAVEQVATSPEAFANLVRTNYQELLGRDPETDALIAWTGFLASGNTSENMIAAIAGSSEYFQKAQTAADF